MNCQEESSDYQPEAREDKIRICKQNDTNLLGWAMENLILGSL